MDKTKEKIPLGIEPAVGKRIIRLDDLDSDEEIMGGADQKLFFGEQPESGSPFAGLFKSPPSAGSGGR